MVLQRIVVCSADIELLSTRRFSVQLEEYVKSTVHSANALVGTCKMGAETDKMAVVDSALKVSPACIGFCSILPLLGMLKSSLALCSCLLFTDGFQS